MQHNMTWQISMTSLLVRLLLLEALQNVQRGHAETICFQDLAANPRTSSVFTRGILEAHGSKHKFVVVDFEAEPLVPLWSAANKVRQHRLRNQHHGGWSWERDRDRDQDQDSVDIFRADKLMAASHMRQKGAERRHHEMFLKDNLEFRIPPAWLRSGSNTTREDRREHHRLKHKLAKLADVVSWRQGSGHSHDNLSQEGSDRQLRVVRTTGSPASSKQLVHTVPISPSRTEQASSRTSEIRRHLFHNSKPERYGVDEQDVSCDYTMLLVDDQQTQHCSATKGRYCIVTGDEECSIESENPGIVAREYFSSIYQYPTISLGPRFEFESVSVDERRRGNRHYLFSFEGSTGEGSYLKADRLALADVVQNHNWKAPFVFTLLGPTVKKPSKLVRARYRSTLLNSSFTLSPVGTNDECFRFWEAIEAGSIPIFVPRQGESKCPDAFADVLRSNPPIVLLDSWTDLPAFLETVNEERINELRVALDQWNQKWWDDMAQLVDDAVDVAITGLQA